MEEMAEEQDNFADRMNDIRNTIESFSKYYELEKIDEYYENVEDVNMKLKKADEEAKLFNARETMFGADNTDYGYAGLKIRNTNIIDILYFYFGIVLGSIDADLCK